MNQQQECRLLVCKNRLPDFGSHLIDESRQTRHMCAHVLLYVYYAQLKQKMQTRFEPTELAEVFTRVRVKGSEQDSLWLTIFELMGSP